MKFYILDDDITICQRISQIIDEENLGNVLTASQNPVKSLQDFDYFDIDVMILDLLMPGIDGINFVKQAKEINPQVEFIMISQVSRKEMIARAYDAGIRFFISKPVNRKEVVRVIESVSELVEMRKKFDFLTDVFSSVNQKNAGIEKTFQEILKKPLMELGIWGEKGANEIIKISEYIKLNRINLAEVSLKEVFAALSDNPANFEQRIRRALSRGLTNLAYIGIEDNLNAVFVQYSNTLYDFESVKHEMEHLRGRRPRGGKVNIRKFLDTLVNF